MAQLKILLNIGTGDAITPSNLLTYKVYKSGSLIKTYGSLKADIEVKKITDTHVMLYNVPITANQLNAITVTVLDADGNESVASGVSSITALDGTEHTVIVQYDINLGGIWKDGLGAATIFNNSVVTTDSKGILEFSALTGNLSGFKIDPVSQLLTTKTYRLYLDVLDKSSELTRLLSYTSVVWANGVVLVDPLVIGMNYFDFVPNVDSAGELIMRPDSNPSGTGYFMNIGDIKLVEL